MLSLLLNMEEAQAKFTHFHVLGMKLILVTAVVIWTLPTVITAKMLELCVQILVSVWFTVVIVLVIIIYMY